MLGSNQCAPNSGHIKRWLFYDFAILTFVDPGFAGQNYPLHPGIAFGVLVATAHGRYRPLAEMHAGSSMNLCGKGQIRESSRMGKAHDDSLKSALF